MSLADNFTPHLTEVQRRAADVAEVEACLERVWSDARAAWPELSLSPEVFLRHLAERLPPDAALVPALQAVHAGDLYLACGCALGDATALTAFERHYMSRVEAYVSRNGVLPGFADELKQVLRVRLLTAEQDILPRVARYNGRGPLEAWVRVAAMRAAINLREAERPTEDLDHGVDALLAETTTPDPELGYLRTRHGGELRAAFKEALGALSDRDSVIVQLYYLRGITAAAMSRMYGVQLRTVQRWVAAIVDRLLAETRRRLAQRLSLPDDELESLMRTLQSQLGSTLVRHFSDDGSGPGPG